MGNEVKVQLSAGEIDALIGSLILLLQLVSGYIGDSTTLTEDQKAAFIDRIKTAQATVPEWK